MRGGRAVGRVGAGLVGALVGALLVLGVASLPKPLDPKPKARSGEAQRSGATPSLGSPPSPRRNESSVLMAWSPGELPRAMERKVEKVRGVDDATTVLAGLEWIEASHTNDGTVIDDPPRGFAIPFEVALVEPEEYAAFVAPGERTTVTGLGRGEVVLAETAAELRRTGRADGLRLDLGHRSVRVSGVASDVASQGYEGLLMGPAPDEWSHTNRYLLMHVHGRGTRARVERRIAQALGPGDVLRVRARGETPFLRYGDAVLPQMLVKESFGEFAGRPLADGRVIVDPAWVRANIRKEKVPLLGEVVCHRALVAQLEGALDDIVSNGLTHAVRRDDYGGCYSARFISRDPGGRLSHHTWGVAIDINVGSNAFGTKADQDPQLVGHMEEWGFTWGGQWLIPDGMHFEWLRWP